MKQSIVHLREGALTEIGSILEELSAQHVFLCVDEDAYHASGAAKVLEPVLAASRVTRFSDFGPHPDLRGITRGIEQFASTEADIVVAFGGGTSIDVAKSIARLAGQHASPREIITGVAPLQPSGPPLVAVPTTAGTGSEATHFAVAYVDGVKYSVADDALRPDYALVDPLLTYALPRQFTAACGLDALCQAVESFWAVGATDQSLDYAAKSLRLAMTHLVEAVQRPTPAARRGMSEAAHLAGRAIDLGKTTAPHALSYGITIHYGVAHGYAVALSLAPVLRYNAEVTDADCNDSRGSQHVRKRIECLLTVMQCPDVEAACRCLVDVMERIGAPVRLAQIGADSDAAIAYLAEQVNLDRLSNNPRGFDREALTELLMSIR